MYRAGINKDEKKRSLLLKKKAKVRKFNALAMDFLRNEIKVYEKYNCKLTIEEKVGWLRDWRSDPRVERIKASREKFLKLRDSFPEVGEFSD